MDWLLERFQGEAGRVAFVHGDRPVTYGEMVEMIDAVQSRTKGLGIEDGETVAVVGDHSPEMFCVLLALARRRCVAIPLSPHSVMQFSAIVGISGCDWYIELCADGELAVERRQIPSDNPLLASLRRRGSPGLVLFSSGSSGQPKGVLHDFRLVAEKFRRQGEAVTAVPFLMADHFGGINTVLAITASLGTVVTVSDRSVAGICTAIARHKVDLLPTTPSFLTLLRASRLHDQFDLSSLRRITYGTEPMPQSTLDWVCRTFPSVRVQQTYGLSEVGVLRSQSRSDGSLWVRVGGEGFRTKVVNGTLWVKSEYAMVGYLNAPTEFDPDGWFNTGDQVQVDGDYIRILGRTTDLINVGGQKVYPAEVESVILDVANVRDVAVCGEPHNLLGQIVVARIVLAELESIESIKRRVRHACLGRLERFKVPSKVVLVEGGLHSARQKKIRAQQSQEQASVRAGNAGGGDEP